MRESPVINQLSAELRRRVRMVVFRIVEIEMEDEVGLGWDSVVIVTFSWDGSLGFIRRRIVSLESILVSVSQE